MCHATPEQTTCSAPECDRPIYVERNGTRHPFCGRTCASQYGDYKYKNCKRVGCNNSPFVDANGRVHPYCGKTCANHDIASRMNMNTRPYDPTDGFDPPPAYLPPSNNNNNYFPNTLRNSNVSSYSTIPSEDCVDVQTELFT
ncbi:14355_t:CDS:2 [Funneliformis mosseae]|uniref:14355_t:CDS:1 n=1 Tax=Funneliformis mosseae TaxID=27381 RepID=A0A9N8VDH4_FUNMO|nr:14355_t:CDS:2 [Funneliformis mosseae]